MKNIKFRKLVCVSLLFLGYTIQGQGQSCENCFVTTWKTEVANEIIMLPIFEGAYDVDFNNNGIFDLTNQIGLVTIIYTDAGEKTIKIRPNSTGNPNKRLRISHYDGENGRAIGMPQKLVSIDNWGDIVWTSMENAFRGCSNMTLADNAGVPDLTMVNNMGHMFRGASSFNGDLSKWNVSSVKRMSYMLDGASSFNGNVSTWNVSNVTETKYMFRDAARFNGNLSNWDVSSVTNMKGTFFGATNFDGNISTWNVSNVQYMHVMFRDATNFTSDLSTWNVSNVTNMEKMFQSATRFNSNISTWNITKVTNMNNMFFGATSFSPQNYDALLIGWSNLSLQSGVTFRAPPTTYCAGKAGKDILINTYSWNITGDMGLSCPVVAPFVTTWNTGTDRTIALPITEGAYDVDTNNDGTFDMINQTGLITITFTDALEKTIRVRPNLANNPNNQLRINHQATGSAPEKLTSIDKWGGIVWTSMENAFRGCSNMTIADNVGVPDLTMVTDISYMFSGATNFTSDLSSWNVSNVINMRRTFSSAVRFNGDISSWNVSNVTNMRRTFSRASDFTRDLSGWNVSKVTRMDHMFFKATNFNGNLSAWDISNVTNMNNMFKNAISFDIQSYDALLEGWSGVDDINRKDPKDNVPFGAPPTDYCNGKAGRDKLTKAVADGGFGWTITGDLRCTCCKNSSHHNTPFLDTKIYPNPVNGNINIESPFTIEKLELYNILGAKLFSISKTNTLNLKSLKQGVYILKVFSEDRVINKKIIKN